MSDSLTLFDIHPGRKIADRYTVVGSHRQGGFSTAFEVSDELDGGARCELQLFPTGLFEGDDQVAEFGRRLRPWMDLDCDRVVSVRAVMELDADTLALVTDYPGGEPLRKRLSSKRPLDHEEVVALGFGMLEGLVVIHAAGLVHGDIKPNTVHVEGEGGQLRSLLVDGGITLGLWTAKGLGERTALIGTPYYAPIEQFGGDAPDVRSDVYNVATLLYEALSGELPWAGSTFLEVFQAKLGDAPPVKERALGVDADPDLEAVIRRGCQADRNKRYASAAEFLAAFEELDG